MHKLKLRVSIQHLKLTLPTQYPTSILTSIHSPTPFNSTVPYLLPTSTPPQHMKETETRTQSHLDLMLENTQQHLIFTLLHLDLSTHTTLHKKLN